MEDFTEGLEGAPLYYAVYGGGGGVPFATCDGVGCAGYIWKYIIRDFQKTRRILRWHYRGHGRSGRPTSLKRLSIPDQCEDLRAVMDAANIEKAVLMGHSMGVQVILEFHRLYPERVAGLIPMCGTYGHILKTFRGADFMDKIFPYLNTLVKLYHTKVGEFWHKVLNLPASYEAAKIFEFNTKLIKKEDLQPYFEHLANMDVRVFVEALKGAAEHTAKDHLPNISVPTLVIAAELDGLTPLSLSKEMHSLIPNSEFLMLPAGSHTAPVELPELVTLRIEKWLSTHFGEEFG